MVHCPECKVQGEYEYCAYCGREMVADEPPVRKPYISPSVTLREAVAQRQSLARPHYYQEPVYDAEPEPKVGEWKLGIGIILLMLSVLLLWFSLIGLSFITWYMKDKWEWRAWAHRVHHRR
jgi:hypothetical protein